MNKMPDHCHPHFTAPQSFTGWVWRMKLDPLLKYLDEYIRRRKQSALSAHSLAQYTQLKQLKATDHIALGEYLQFFTAVAHELGDACLGARIGLNSPSPVLSPLRELFLNGQTLHDALLELNRSTPALQDGTSTDMRVHDEHAVVSYQLSACIPEPMARQDALYSLGLLIHALRSRLGANWCPQKLCLRQRLDEHERLTLARMLGGACVEGGGAHNCIVFPGRLLAHRRPPSGHDENVLVFFRQYVQDLCAEHSGNSFQGRVRSLLEAHLSRHIADGQSPSLEWAASLLHLSPRSLQRKLALENVSFSSVLEQVRHDLALQWMRQRHLHIGDLAEHLGYANHAAFCNAFKRWSGVAPSRYRRVMNAGLIQNAARTPSMNRRSTVETANGR